MSSITNVPHPLCPECEQTPPPQHAVPGTCIWAGYLPPEEVERMFIIIRTGNASKSQRNVWLWHWYRVVLMVMKTKMKTAPECGWYYRDGWLFRTYTKVNPRHESFFEFLTDRILDLSYRPDLVRTPKTSASLYFTLRYSFWIWKAQWELVESGVGGIRPFENKSVQLGRALVDYHYWRNKAVWYYETSQPTVQQSYDLLAGNVPDMLPEGDELKKDRRPTNPEDVLHLWAWFNEILTPHNQPTREL